MRHEPLPASELAVRSLLMRLYHSREAGEESYYAGLVNGEAPALEAKGWIERHGDGWRMTDVGVVGWAEMNPLIFDSKRDYNARFNRSLRDEVEKIMGEVRLCNVEGCQAVRMVSASGKVQTFCEEHQREYWRVADERKQARKAAAKGEASVQSVGQFTDGEPAPQAERVTMGEAEQMYMEKGPSVQEPPLGKVVEMLPKVDGKPQSVVIEVQAPDKPYYLHGESHDCKDCYAKGVIEALRAKSPKLAALIDAIEAEQRAAFELGL